MVRPKNVRITNLLQRIEGERISAARTVQNIVPQDAPASCHLASYENSACYKPSALVVDQYMWQRIAETVPSIVGDGSKGFPRTVVLAQYLFLEGRDRNSGDPKLRTGLPLSVQYRACLHKKKSIIPI